MANITNNGSYIEIVVHCGTDGSGVIGMDGYNEVCVYYKEKSGYEIFSECSCEHYRGCKERECTSERAFEAWKSKTVAELVEN